MFLLSQFPLRLRPIRSLSQRGKNAAFPLAASSFMLEHNVPKEELETRASPFNKVTIALLLPDQDVWRGGGVSCQELRVAGSH